MGCSASKQSKGREDYSTLRADSSPNVPLVSAASIRPTARELLVVPDNKSKSSVLEASTLPKQTLPPEPSTPSHSIDPFQSIVTRDSPTRNIPSFKKSPLQTSKPPARPLSSSLPPSSQQQQQQQYSPTALHNSIQVIPNSSRDTKRHNTSSHTSPKPKISSTIPRHLETHQHQPPFPEQSEGRVGRPPSNSNNKPQYPLEQPTYSAQDLAASIVSSVGAASAQQIPPATRTTPHYSEKEAPKKHHKKKKKKRHSKTRESKSRSRERDEGGRTRERESKERESKTTTRERRPSKTKETTAATMSTSKPPPTSRADKFKPRLSQKAFSMFSIETPKPCSKSGMKFDELYKLKGVLGTGAFSTVREGQHRTSNDITYAVKCVNRKKLSNEDEAALLDEVEILKELKHPHIIRLYDFFVTPQTYYLVMERMCGGELFDRIVAKAYYNEKEARDVCMILIQAIGYCHEQKVAHRDLKPENLLLLSDDDDSTVKIADFGFAKKCPKPNTLTTQCGTPGYVAPEILDGIPYDTKCDMWSCGVILYILLGGYPPFIENNQRELFKKIRKGDYEFHPEYWSNVSQEAKDLITSLLTVDPSKRLDAEQALDNTWIRGDDDTLEKKDLGPNLAELKKFNAKRKFKAAVYGVMASNKLQSLGQDFQKNLS